MATTYYVNLNSSVNGDGSEGSPFNSDFLYTLTGTGEDRVYKIYGEHILSAGLAPNVLPDNVVLDWWYDYSPWRLNLVRNSIVVVGTVDIYNCILETEGPSPGASRIDGINLLSGCYVKLWDHTPSHSSLGNVNRCVVACNDDSFSIDAGSSVFNDCTIVNYGSYVPILTSARGTSGYSSSGTMEFDNVLTNVFELSALSNGYVLSGDGVTLSASATSADWRSTNLSDFNVCNSIDNAPAWTSGAPAYGSVGSFYFGPIYESISATPTLITITALVPTVNAVSGESVTITQYPIRFLVSPLIPDVYAASYIGISFVGTPRIGATPLIVDFKAMVTFGGGAINKYRVVSYTWYFDYINHPEISETTTLDEITHVFVGYSSQKFSVKCCATVEPL